MVSLVKRPVKEFDELSFISCVDAFPIETGHLGGANQRDSHSPTFKSPVGYVTV